MTRYPKVPSRLFRADLQLAWREHTLAAIQAKTGVSSATLHRIIRSDDFDTIQIRTAVKLRTGLRKLGAD